MCGGVMCIEGSFCQSCTERGQGRGDRHWPVKGIGQADEASEVM